MSLKIGELQVDIGANTKPFKAAEKEVEKGAKKIDKSLESIEVSAKQTDKAIDDLSKEMMEAGAASGVAAKQYDGANQNLNQTKKAANDAGKGLKRAKHFAGQAGFQFADMAVQAQMGTNALVIIGQQGSQLLGALGPMGAVAGAVLAIATAIGFVLQKSMNAAKKSAEDLNSVLDELDKTIIDIDDDTLNFSETLRKLSGVSDTAVALKLANAIDTTQKAIDGAKKSALALLKQNGALSSGFASLINSFQKGDTTLRRTADAYADFFLDETDIKKRDKIRKFTTELQDLAEVSEKAQKRLKFLETGVGGDLGEKNATKEEQERENKKKKREDDRAKRRQKAQEDEDQRIIAALKEESFAAFRVLDTSLRTEEEAIAASHVRRQQIVDDALIDGVISQEKANAINLKIQDKHAEESVLLANKKATALMMVNREAASAVSSLLNATGDDQAARAARVIDGAMALAQTIATISQATAIAQSAADPTALTLPQKFANIALMTSQFVNIFSLLKSAKGGGRQHGGVVSPGLTHQINERGTPEILNQGSKQFLLPTGKGGNITPMKQGGGNSPVNVSILSTGTPQTITGTQSSNGEIMVMIDNAVKASEGRSNASLASGRGPAAQSLQKGFRVDRNLTGGR